MIRFPDNPGLIPNNYARGKIIIPFLILTWLIYAYMLFYSIPAVMKYSGGMQLFDMLPTGYSSEYAHNLLTILGEEGRHIYLSRQIPIDMIYPLLFAVTYTLLQALILKHGFKSTSPIQWLCFIPIFAGLFDYLENVGIIVMLKRYPDFSPMRANITCVFSIAKAAFTTIFWLLLLVGALTILKKRSMK